MRYSLKNYNDSAFSRAKVQEVRFFLLQLLDILCNLMLIISFS